MYPILHISTVGDYMVNFFLLSVGLFLLVIALALCGYLLECCARAFDAICNWLEGKLHRRKVRRRSLAYLERSAHRSSPVNKQHPSPAAINQVSAKRTNVLPYRARVTASAREALRRSSSQESQQPDFPRGA